MITLNLGRVMSLSFPNVVGSIFRNTGLANFYMKGLIFFSPTVVLTRNEPQQVTAAPQGESWDGYKNIRTSGNKQQNA